MTTIPVILATAGHVDHGKSALVQALTGTDPDRLPEEKARGITIDLGFAHFQLPAPNAHDVLEVGVIDVPGHEDFVKNMVAGLGGIDAALLAVAADDGWMPQTEEHTQILDYLGVSRVVVALTKADVCDNIDDAVAKVRQRLIGRLIANAPVIPTSVVDGRGLQALRDALSLTLGGSPLVRGVGKPRLSVDRAFTLRGIGTVVTGTLGGGELRTSDRVFIRPHGAGAHIRTMQSYGRTIQIARPGSRVALNLPEGVPRITGSAQASTTIGRGDVVTSERTGEPVTTIDVLLRRSECAAGPVQLKSGSAVRVHHGSACLAARLRLPEGPLLSGASAVARLKLASPALVLTGDRLVVRDEPERQTLAGGIVLDVGGPRLRKSGAQWQLLSTRAAGPLDARICLRTQFARDGIVDRRTLLTRSTFSTTEIEQATDQLLREDDIVAGESHLFDRLVWDGMFEAMLDAVDRHHDAHPEQAGIPIVEIKHQLAGRGLPIDAFEALLAGVAERGLVRHATILRRVTHRLSLPPRLERAGAILRQMLAAKPFDPPSRKDLTRDDVSMQAMRFLIASGEAVEVSPDVVLSSAAYAGAIERVRAHLRVRGSATVSELKAMLASSRRVMVPLVEKLDRDGVTRRQGDLRVLRQQ